MADRRKRDSRGQLEAVVAEYARTVAGLSAEIVRLKADVENLTLFREGLADEHAAIKSVAQHWRDRADHYMRRLWRFKRAWPNLLVDGKEP